MFKVTGSDFDLEGHVHVGSCTVPLVDRLKQVAEREMRVKYKGV